MEMQKVPRSFGEFSFLAFSFKYFEEFHLEFATTPWQTMSGGVNPGDLGTCSFLHSRLSFWTSKVGFLKTLFRTVNLYGLLGPRLLVDRTVLDHTISDPYLPHVIILQDLDKVLTPQGFTLC